MAENREKSGMEYTAQAAGLARGAVKAGKSLAGAGKGAAFGPAFRLHGFAAGLAWDNRHVIGKILAAFLLVLFLPLVLLMMIPGALFGSNAEDWDEDKAEEILFENYEAVTEVQSEACDAMDAVMQSAHDAVLERIEEDFMTTYGEYDEMRVTDPYEEELPHDSTRILCEYSALTGFADNGDTAGLTEKLSEFTENFFFYMVIEEEKSRDDIPYIEVRYKVLYIGDDYITEEVFELTEEQKALAADFADNLNLYTGGEDNAETD